MDAQLIGLVATIVGLFGWLLKNTMAENSKRESKYQELLDKMVEKYDGITNSIDGLAEEIRNKRKAAG